MAVHPASSPEPDRAPHGAAEGRSPQSVSGTVARRAAPASPAVSLVASLVLLAHGSLVAVGLVAWARTPAVVSWRVLVALLVVVLSWVTSALLWTRPSRGVALGALAVLVLGLARLGGPAGWSSYSYAVVALTALCSLPLLRAAFALD